RAPGSGSGSRSPPPTAPAGCWCSRTTGGGSKRSTTDGRRLMGWGNPPMPWRELEQRLSGKFAPPGQNRPPKLASGPEPERPSSTRRAAYRGRDLERAVDAVPYAELHAHTNFSFLDGASHPEEMVEEAVRLGLSALAITDHDGFYGVVRFADAAAR